MSHLVLGSSKLSDGGISSAAGVTLADRQDAHFYGFGDPDHIPSTLQNITTQRYKGELLASLFVEREGGEVQVWV